MNVVIKEIFREDNAKYCSGNIVVILLHNASILQESVVKKCCENIEVKKCCHEKKSRCYEKIYCSEIMML